MVSHLSSMQSFWKHKEDAVRFVSEVLPNLPLDSPLIITMSPEKLEGFYVTIATTESLAGIVIPFSLDGSPIT